MPHDPVAVEVTRAVGLEFVGTYIDDRRRAAAGIRHIRVINETRVAVEVRGHIPRHSPIIAGVDTRRTGQEVVVVIDPNSIVPITWSAVVVPITTIDEPRIGVDGAVAPNQLAAILDVGSRLRGLPVACFAASV